MKYIILLFNDNKRNDKTERKSVCSRNNCSHEKVREKSVVVKSVMCGVCVCVCVCGGGGGGGEGDEPSPINYCGDTSPRHHP